VVIRSLLLLVVLERTRHRTIGVAEVRGDPDQSLRIAEPIVAFLQRPTRNLDDARNAVLGVLKQVDEVVDVWREQVDGGIRNL
jgi:hypothetical protein